jgi:nicotinate-nucleotide adenylyltransferase
MRIGVLGGTFDPVHLGHLRIAEEVRLQLELRRLIFIPAGQPLLRAQGPLSSAADRLQMVDLAVAGNPAFQVCRSEIKRSGPSYTVDTLAELLQRLGTKTRLFFIVGVDVLDQFHRWKDPEQVLELCHLVVVTRPGHEGFDRCAWSARFPRAAEKLTLLSGLQIDISGTEIRRRAARGDSLRNLVPEPVEEYIRERGLYLPGPAAAQAGPTGVSM